ncbi:TPA: glutamate racemase [Patescibacteria group bacterium]|nr:MAG: Glutamate racemase [Parcubacteria group bacterium GW2011_GWF2_40_10]KKR46495.1 MAG: Glutamate racemase [Parcubacteria group bacterium GW2011_GWA2_40_143]KKR60436.1 MAG: Glutamate racemase [Parcubacteria group bacterium GW2011_GWC2_40_31]KKR82878.1 MAG: Glutamate racemase [Parcubacteria group bacterium GW2011_GWD2_40_9]HCI04771.1 glutamate racemase [Patescibacteria group bacterium]
MKKKIKGTIGVFDSGFGGLLILKDIVKRLPQYDYMYLADSARAPYGDHSKEAVYNFTEQAVDFLFKKGCEIIVLACNTASAEALRRIQQEYLPKRYPERRVLGVIVPASEAASEFTKNGRVGVLATTGTVLSKTFPAELKKINNKTKVFQKACPLLVPLIENGEHDTVTLAAALEDYLSFFKNKNVDTLILGCTHYGVLEKKIKRSIGADVSIVSEGKIVADKLADYLKRHNEIEKFLLKGKKRIFYTTDLTARFESLGSKFFGQKLKPIKIRLD